MVTSFKEVNAISGGNKGAAGKSRGDVGDNRKFGFFHSCRASAFRVQGLRFRVLCSGLRILRGYQAQGSGFRAQGFSVWFG